MITEADIEKSLEWLRDNAGLIAMAKGKSYLLDQQTKSVRADLMSRSGENTAAAKEIEALSHPDYEKHLSKTAEAISDYEELRLLRDYHMAKIEAWRTESSNQRAMANFR